MTPPNLWNDHVCRDETIAVWLQNWKCSPSCIFKKVENSMLDDVIMTPQTIEMTPNRFFRVAEMKLLLFDPKNALLVGFLRKLKNPLRVLDDVIMTPQTIEMTPNRFFRVAKMKLLLFDPKNAFLAGFLRKLKNQLRVLDDVIMTPPNHRNDPKPIFSSCRDETLAVWPQKRSPSWIFKEVEKSTTSSEKVLPEAKVYTFDRVTRRISKRHH